MYDETDRFHLSYAETVYAAGGRIKWNLDDCLERVTLNR